MGKSQNNVTIKDAMQYTQDDQHLQVAQKIVAKKRFKEPMFSRNAGSTGMLDTSFIFAMRPPRQPSD